MIKDSVQLAVDVFEPLLVLDSSSVCLFVVVLCCFSILFSNWYLLVLDSSSVCLFVVALCCSSIIFSNWYFLFCVYS